MIGIIDNQLNHTVHTIIAVSFFASIFFYFFILIGQIQANGLSLLNETQKKRVGFLGIFRYVMLVILLVTVASLLTYYDNVPSPFLEWISTLVLFNFFTFMALLDDNYMEVVVKADHI